MRPRPWRSPTESREFKKRRRGLVLRAWGGDETKPAKSLGERFWALPHKVGRRPRLAAARALIRANPRSSYGYMLEAFAWGEHPGAVRT